MLGSRRARAATGAATAKGSVPVTPSSPSSAPATSARRTPPCMAELGFDVLGMDVDAEKIAALAAGRVPFYEPGLDELLRRAGGRRPAALHHRLRTELGRRCGETCTSSASTPRRSKGEYAARHELRRVPRSTSLAPLLTRPALVVGKSTVPVGTAARLAEPGCAALAPAGEASSWPGTPSSCARASRSRTRCARTGSSSACAATRRRAAPARRSTRRCIDAGIAADRHRLRHRRAGQERRQRVPGHQDLLHQRHGRGLRGGRRRRGRARRGARPTTRGSAAASCGAGLGFGGGCLPKDIRAFMARAGELGVDQALTFLQRGRRDQHAPPRPAWSSSPARQCDGSLPRQADRGAGAPRSSRTPTTCATPPR